MIHWPICCTFTESDDSVSGSGSGGGQEDGGHAFSGSGNLLPFPTLYKTGKQTIKRYNYWRVTIKPIMAEILPNNIISFIQRHTHTHNGIFVSRKKVSSSKYNPINIVRVSVVMVLVGILFYNLEKVSCITNDKSYGILNTL